MCIVNYCLVYYKPLAAVYIVYKLTKVIESTLWLPN